MDGFDPPAGRGPRLLRTIAATARVQVRLLFRNPEDWIRILVMPLYALVAMAVLAHSGRMDLAGYAVTAALLFAIGDMAFFVSSETVSNDRRQQMLELLVAAPSSYLVIILTRTLLVTSLGLLGFLEGWGLARLVFGVPIPVHHPWILVATLLATALAAGGSAVITAALFSLARSARTFQNAINGPLYLLGGTVVPVTFLPVGLQLLSPLVFFYWSADLVRDVFVPAAPADVAFRLFALLALAAVSAAIGGLLLGRMLDRLRASGRLGLT